MGRLLKRKKWLVPLILYLCIGLWIFWGNSAIECNTFIVDSNRVPEAFEGYRIAHISDLHNGEMGKENEKLLRLLEASEPDIIAITGDLIDSRSTDVGIALEFVEKAVKIAPCYYVTGNHEIRVPDAYEQLEAGMKAAGVTILENATGIIDLQGESLVIAGIADPSAQTDYLTGDEGSVADRELQAVDLNNDQYTILLSHRPELLSVYTEHGIDLVLSGHAHGGQFRIPFIGGLIAPNQGFFPQYDAGHYTKGSTNMIVSRGIGNSLFPFRVNNPPEIILVELHCA